MHTYTAADLITPVTGSDHVLTVRQVSNCQALCYRGDIGAGAQ
jgi:hypothetical protein